MPKVYGKKSKRVAVSMRLDPEVYNKVTRLAHSTNKSYSWIYKTLMKGSLRTIELAQENSQPLEDNNELQKLTKMTQANDCEKMFETRQGASELAEIHSRLAGLEAKIEQLNIYE